MKARRLRVSYSPLKFKVYILVIATDNRFSTMVSVNRRTAFNALSDIRDCFKLNWGRQDWMVTPDWMTTDPGNIVIKIGFKK